tara:strand:- start:1 stop:216 length:216 start_codon:yes stop_codon:yes gene_type:complete
MKKIYFNFLVLFILGCKDEDPSSPCKGDGLDGGVCIEIYQPVCGCDNVTYSNTCYAEIGGVTSWADGECSG